MPRKKLIRTDQFIYHITNRSNNREWFYIPIEQCWGIFTHSLAEAAERYGAEIHSFVLLSNHFHALISTPQGNLDDVMRYFQSVATARIQRIAGRINHVFGARYSWSVLDSPEILAYVFKYVYRNPVRNHLSRTVEDYKFSSLNRLGPLPLVEGFDDYWSLIPKNRKNRIEWLNIPTQRELEALITRGLRRARFSFTTTAGLQRNLRLLKQSYLVLP